MAVRGDELPNSEKERRLAELLAALGYKRLSRTWGKCEIVIGLFAVGIGLFRPICFLVFGCCCLSSAVISCWQDIAIICINPATS